MAHLPKYLQPFQNQALDYLSQGWVQEIEFSGATYQIQFINPSNAQEVWTFIQLDSKGEISDGFCSCELGEGMEACPHLAAAFLRIYNGWERPLHQRFEKSLWHRLCLIFFENLGDKTRRLDRVDSSLYECNTLSGKRVFFIRAKTEAGRTLLSNILERRPLATEETSLKFSNLPQEELALWREGHPSQQLAYELSFWGDIAHWLMKMQEAGSPYEISFGYSSQQLPNFITLSFPDVELGFYLSEANLSKIIPTLNSVNAPLRVFAVAQEDVQRITYDKERGALLIHTKPTEVKEPTTQGIAINGWVLFPEEGFYPSKQNPSLLGRELQGAEIEQALTEYPELMQSLLEDATYSTDPITLSYSLAFDDTWNLHISAYALTPGDLSRPSSRLFGSWIYLDGGGFHPIYEPPFKGVSPLTVPEERMEDFIRQERAWLNQQEGFQVHLANIKAQLTYHLSPDNHLSFSRLALQDAHVEGRTKDFGSWVFVEGRGFYSKATLMTTLPISEEWAIPADQIPLFIRMNSADLRLVPGFFSPHQPVIKSELTIQLNDKEEITIDSHYVLQEGYVGKDVRLFDDFVFVAGEGFSELPPHCRLPEGYQTPITLEPSQVTAFLKHGLNTLQRYSPKVDARLVAPKKLELLVQDIDKEQRQYSLELSYQTEHGQIPATSIWKAIKMKKQWLFTPAGCLDVTERRFDWIRQLQKHHVDARRQRATLSVLELIRLNATEELHVAPGKNQEKSEKHLQELATFALQAPPDLKGYTGQLRPYQQIGVHWLWFLYLHGLSGMLCDEMGLGKTHQAMALISALLNQNADSRGPFLVICPTSVIYHWKERLAEFLPNARIYVYYGGERSLEAFHGQYDILLTTYGIVRQEAEELKKIPFELAVYDEIQIAKNHLSRTHTALRKLNAKMRIGLTGTPLENQLRELKALFDLVIPGYMPRDSDFREHFIKPIERDSDPARQELLIRLVRPFILRRKKAEVLLDLPAKTEEISHCDLSEEQKLLYQGVLLQSRQRLLDQLADGSSDIPYMHIFAVLMHLKQICNHPAVFLKKPESYKEFTSGKWELFVELFSEARESQQKVVIFSQYLLMLDIFKSYLSEMGIPYAEIRGSTQNRGEQVARFNKDPNCLVFLGSLQAAGLGLDLTAGSVVIHYDRWWNAARENQATDRVHRIGQTRGVQVFKLVTRGTFEERIDEIIARKAHLMEEIVRADDHRFMKTFTREELIQLLGNLPF